MDSDGKGISTALRGRGVLHDPSVNRGVAFTEKERQELGLVGLLPPQVLSLDEQAERAYGQFQRQGTDLGKNVFCSLLHDRNEVLFYRLLADHLGEMLPIVYTPTVGEAIRNYSGEYRGSRGVYLSVDRPGEIEDSLQATGLESDDVDLIVATDGEAILGIGDWGVGGIAISVGKLAVYTAAAGIDPGRTIPVVLDVGTNRQSLLDDPLYLGNRHQRVDEKSYDEFIDAYVTAAGKLFPHALLHWEDLGAANSRRVLERYAESRLSFNDDIQGTGAVALAAVHSALQASGGRLKDQRVVIYGAGTAGIGIADQLAAAMAEDGSDNPSQQFWTLSSRGLIADNTEGIRDFQRGYARPAGELSSLKRGEDEMIGLAEVVEEVSPTVLIGTSGQPGSFTEEIVRKMAAGTKRPVILPLSNPTSLSEADPAELLEWTDGKALVATGSPFPPATVGRHSFVVAQANNALVFPGLGLGAIVSRARRITPKMLRAAAGAVAGQIDTSLLGAPLLPQIEALRETSYAVAVAVCSAARDEKVAERVETDYHEAVKEAMWEPSYPPIVASAQ